MKIINSIQDLRNLVDKWSGAEGLETAIDSHEDNVKLVADRIAAERPDGLNYGDDWEKYLASTWPVRDYLDYEE